MKQLILASNSPQRKKLLKDLGLPVKVHPSHADEITKIKTTCSALVKTNALLKAQAVADQHKSGIIIGADTVVYAGNKKMLLKPKDYKDAKRILRILFSKPTWVYTGVAVIDAKTGQTVTDYEKTKVFMSKLSDEEMNRYHKRVNPLDKAGGFDIEGWGSVFIHRIEGCYTNVIGLPMAKLGRMLKKMGVSFLSLLVMITLTGCSTEFNLATQQEESLMYTTEKEVKLGAKVAAKIEAQYTINTDVDINERVERVFEKIVAVCDRKDIVYFIKVIDDDEIFNAISLPGGYVYLFTGLLNKIENDDQLAGVIAHEIGHITARHAVKRLQAAYGALALQLASTQTNSRFATGVNIALNSLFLEHSQKAEFESDRLGVKYMTKAGYDPNEMIRFLEIMQNESNKRLNRYSYWRTHPHVPERIGVVGQEIKGEMEFEDYIRLIGTDPEKYH